MKTLSQLKVVRDSRTGCRVGSGGWLRPARWAAGIILGISLVNIASADNDKGGDRCEQTAEKALYSCQAQARSDYWLALAKCDNLADPAERAACRKQAAADQKEAFKLCKEQQDAREDVCDRLGGAPYDPVTTSSPRLTIPTSP